MLLSGHSRADISVSAFDAFRQSSNRVGIDSIASSSRVHFNGDFVRVGVNYHLN
jgi:hypothetical protein